MSTASAMPPVARRRRSNWALRLLAVGLSALSFIGFWQIAMHTPKPTTSAPGGAGGPTFAPPTGGQGGLILPGDIGKPHGGTHVS